MSGIFYNISYYSYCYNNIFNVFSEFIKGKFLIQNKQPKRDIFAYPTTATDTSLVKTVVDQIYEIIIRKILEDFAWFVVKSMKIVQIELLIIFLDLEDEKNFDLFYTCLFLLISYEINYLYNYWT